MNTDLLQYIEDHTSPEDKILSELRRYTFLKVVHPRMISGPVQGKFLELISKILHPKKILEVGTYTGYSAICLAKGLAPGGKVLSYEINDELKSVQDLFFRKAGLSDKIQNVIANAIEELPNVKEQFDLIFLDGNKEEYPQYYDLCFPLLKTGGILLADNVLWDGKVVATERTEDSPTQAIKSFNKKVMGDSRTENVLLPMRDGLMICKKNRD